MGILDWIGMGKNLGHEISEPIWTAGLLILLYYAPQIIITTYVWAKNCIGFDEVIQYPMPSTDIMNLIYLVFGFGIYHIANRKLNH